MVRPTVAGNDQHVSGRIDLLATDGWGIRLARLAVLATRSFVALVLTSSIAWGQDNGDSELAVYQVVAEGSDIRLLIHRTGVLSWLGHNHVVSVAQLRGTVYVHPDIERSRFELEIPVHGLIVDDPILRRQEGDEFSTGLSKDDIVRTRDNMLGKRVLNADLYPVVTLAGTGPRGAGPEFILPFTIEILGDVVDLQIPFILRLDKDVLEASGAFQLSHSDLGMRPFSTMLGALRVADELNFKFRVRAHRIQAKE